jgi:hypothetical protein
MIIFEDGKEYRVITYNYGDVVWLLNNELHREKGPAVFGGPDFSYKHWYQNYLYHRLDGPAVIWANDDKRWYINGKEITEQKHTKVRTMLAFGLDKI